MPQRNLHQPSSSSPSWRYPSRLLPRTNSPPSGPTIRHHSPPPLPLSSYYYFLVVRAIYSAVPSASFQIIASNPPSFSLFFRYDFYSPRLAKSNLENLSCSAILLANCFSFYLLIRLLLFKSCSRLHFNFLCWSPRPETLGYSAKVKEYSELARIHFPFSSALSTSVVNLYLLKVVYVLEGPPLVVELLGLIWAEGVLLDFGASVFPWCSKHRHLRCQLQTLHMT